MIRRAKPHANSVEEHLRDLAGILNTTIDGRLDNTGSVTLTTSSATTVVTNVKVHPEAKVFLQATDANAAAETIHVSDVGDNQFTLTHANSGTTRTFDYMVIG